MGGDRMERGLGRPPSTTPPASVRAAILARVVQQTVGGADTPLLDGRYRLLREIGRGGAGTVWEAELLPLGRLVAVKLLRPGVASGENAVARLMREAMSVSKLGHDHIVRVNDVGTDEHGSPYVAMELVPGESLAQLVRRTGPMPWREVAEITLQLCDALSAAHAVGIVHRDLKPANVMAARHADGGWRCKLLDFGLCTAGTETPMLTAAGVLLGTPGYAAPEQIRGETVDGRADLYGLGCVMVELLTGRPAFRGDRQQAVAHQLEGRRCDDLDRLDLPDDVVGLIDRCLSLDAERRHDGPEALASAIRTVGETALPRPRDAAPMKGLGWWAAGIVGVAIGFLAVAWPSDESARLSAAIPRMPIVRLPERPMPIEEEREVPVVHDVEVPATVAPPTAARKRRPRRPAPAAAAEEAPPRREYPEGIRDPFAVR